MGRLISACIILSLWGCLAVVQTYGIVTSRGPSPEILAYLFLLWSPIIGLPLGYTLLVIRGSDARRQKSTNKLRALLMRGEKPIHSAMQTRLSSLFSRRILVSTTNSRLIVLHRSLLGGFTPYDWQWKDVLKVHMKENILPGFFGSSLEFITVDNQHVVIPGVPSNEAAAMYKHGQAQEQAWDEKRRVRGLEEMRAQSGGFHMQGGHMGGAGPSNSSLDRLQQAQKMKNAGLISDAEFEEIKAKILSQF